MTKFETLVVSVDDDGIAHVALSRPEKRNALSDRMIAELTDVAGTIGKSRETRAMVLSGRGEVFCAGADLELMRKQIGTDRAGRMSEARKLAEMLRALNEMPTPLIGRLHGGAFGGGAGLACVCDVAIAEQGCRFGFTETRLGLIPATIGPYVLARLGEGPARRVFMSSRIFEAKEAADLGLVSRVVAADELDRCVLAEVKPYLRTAPDAVGRAKALARSLGPRIDDAVIDQTIERLADSWETDEAREGIVAFLEKRAASWHRR